MLPDDALMRQNPYPQYPRRIAASRAIHRHISDSLMGFGFRTVVAVAELEGFQALFAAIELHSGA